MVYACESVTFGICAKTANSTEPESELLRGGTDQIPYSIPSAGNRVFLLEGWPLGKAVSMDLAEPYGLDTLALGDSGPLASIDVSPDGRWIAYVNANDELWVESLDPAVSQRDLVSSDRSGDPLWTKGGLELVYRSRDDRSVYAVPFDPLTGEVGAPESLFGAPYVLSPNRRYRQWAVTPDGQRFIMVKGRADQRPRRLVLVQNFFEELNRLAPVD